MNKLMQKNIFVYDVQFHSRNEHEKYFGHIFCHSGDKAMPPFGPK